MTYVAQRGSVAARVLEYLREQPEGFEISSLPLAEAVDADPSTVTVCLRPAVNAGQLVRFTKPGNAKLLWWKLGDGKPLVLERDEPLRKTPADVEVKPGEIFPGVTGTGSSDPVPPEEEEAAAAPAVLASAARREAFAQSMERRIAPDLPVPVLPAAAPAQPQRFDAWLSGVSGELVLQGVSVDADGDVVLQSKEVQALRRVLLGIPA